MPGFIILMALLVMTAGSGMAEEAGKASGEKVYPHVEKGHCEVCHVASEADLNSWFTFGSTKKKLRADFNALCLQCHNIALGHGVGKPPKINREQLPLDSEGKINCAITCHNMHVKSEDQKQSRYHLRTTVDRLCQSCHET